MSDIKISYSARTCSMSPEGLKSVRKKAAELLEKGMKRAFADFPIDRSGLLKQIVIDKINPKNVCQTFMAKSDASAEIHNYKRLMATRSRLEPDDATKKGIISTRLGLFVSCPANYDWKNSPVYNGISSCRDLKERIGRKKLPVVLYGVKTSPKEAQAVINNLSSVKYYMNYSGNPLICSSKYAANGDQVVSHAIRVPVTIEYILRGTNYNNYSAWTLLKECTTRDGRTINHDDLAFNFGVRTFVPIKAEVDGKTETYTLIIGMSAAASTSEFAALISDEFAFKKFLSGTYAKKLLIEAKVNGWKVKND